MKVFSFLTIFFDKEKRIKFELKGIHDYLTCEFELGFHYNSKKTLSTFKK